MVVRAERVEEGEGGGGVRMKKREGGKGGKEEDMKPLIIN